MNRSEVIDSIRQQLSMTKSAATEAFDTIALIIRDGLLADGEVAISGVGKLLLKDTQARTRRNPKTGEPIQVPARRSVKFRAAKEMKEILAK